MSGDRTGGPAEEPTRVPADAGRHAGNARLDVEFAGYGFPQAPRRGNAFKHNQPPSSRPGRTGSPVRLRAAIRLRARRPTAARR